MTNEEILKKAIEKAVRNGYEANSLKDHVRWCTETKKFKNVYTGKMVKLPQDKEGILLNFVNTHWNWSNLDWDTSSQLGLAFSHGFAKCFWGEKDIVLDTPSGKKIHGVNIPAWEWHLQQMVLEEDPISYLSQFLDK